MATRVHNEERRAVTEEAFSREEQEAWLRTQEKLRAASEIGHTSQLKFAKANDELNQAELASREAEAAAARQAEHDRELQRHQNSLEGLKAKIPQLHDAQASAARTAEEKLAAQQHARQQLTQAEQVAAEKENALRGIAPDLERHHQHHQSLEAKLAEHRALTKQREEEHRLRQREHDELRRAHETNMGLVERLTREHDPLLKELEEHEARLVHLRKRHDEGLRAIYAAKDKANHSHQKLHSYDPQLHNHALDALQSHKRRERELAEELTAAKQRAHEHQHHHDLALAAHKKALGYLESLRGRAPDDREVLEARRAQESAQARLAELEAQAKRSHAAFRHHRGGADEHGGRAAELQALADRHAQAYQAMRREGDDAVRRKEALWTEAKQEGDTGLGHFKEKVTTLDSRLDQLGDRIKGAITGNKAGTTTHTHSEVATGPSGAHHTLGSNVVNSGASGGGLSGAHGTTAGTAVDDRAVHGAARNGNTGSAISNDRGGVAGVGQQAGVTQGLATGQTAGHTTSAGLLSGNNGTHTAGVAPGTPEHTATTERTTTTGHTTAGGLTANSNTNPTTGHHSTTTTTTHAEDGSQEGGIKAKIKGLFGSK